MRGQSGRGPLLPEWRVAERKSHRLVDHTTITALLSAFFFPCAEALIFSFTRQLVHTCFVPGPSLGIRRTASSDTQMGPVRGLQPIEGHSESQQKPHSMIHCVRIHTWYHGIVEGHRGQVTSTAPNRMIPQGRRSGNGVRHSRQRGIAHAKAQR